MLGRARRLRSLARPRTVLSKMWSTSMSTQTGLWWIVPVAFWHAKVAVTGLLSRDCAPAGRSASVASCSRLPMVNAPRSPAGTVILIFIAFLQNVWAEGGFNNGRRADSANRQGACEPVKDDLVHSVHSAHVAVLAGALGA